MRMKMPDRHRERPTMVHLQQYVSVSNKALALDTNLWHLIVLPIALFISDASEVVCSQSEHTKYFIRRRKHTSFLYD